MSKKTTCTTTSKPHCLSLKVKLFINGVVHHVSLVLVKVKAQTCSSCPFSKMYFFQVTSAVLKMPLKYLHSDIKVYILMWCILLMFMMCHV